jgi:hypothetical protein
VNSLETVQITQIQFINCIIVAISDGTMKTLTKTEQQQQQKKAKKSCTSNISY